MPKGIYKRKPFSEEHRQHLSEALKGHKKSNEMKKRMSESKKGHFTSTETRKKISEALKGQTTWNKGLTKITDERVKALSETLKGIPTSTKTKRKLSKALKGRKLTKEHIRQILTRRIPSTLEEKFQNILDKYNLPYKYVGNGKFFIERCNPDFINTNSEKIAIEVYARFYKQLGERNIKKWKERRTKIFKKYGWDIIFFNEVEVNEDYVLTKLKDRR